QFLMRHAIYLLRSIARYSRSTGVFMATSLRRSFARGLPSSKYSLFTAISAWRSSSRGQCPRSSPCHGGWRVACGHAHQAPSRIARRHELALGQRDRRVGALERGVDQHGGAFAAVARAARPMPGILVRNYLEVVLGLAAVGHGPQQRIGVLGRDVLVDGDDPFA